MKVLKVVLTLIPFVWAIGLIPFVNRVKPIVLGLPFLAFWMVAVIYIACLCIAGLYYIDKHQQE